MTELPCYPPMPEHSLVVLIGPSGAGKSTLARTWPASQVLSLDALREVVSDDAGDQDATGDAVAALHLLLEARMRRRLFTVVDATNVTRAAREPLLAAARRHSMLPVAVMVATPGSVCIERQGPRPDNRTVPADVVLRQLKEMVDSHRTLRAEGFGEIVFSDSLGRLLPFLQRLSEARQTDLGLDGGAGLGDLNLVSRVFGEEIVPLWQWKPGSDIAGGDRVAEIRLGRQHLTLALRTDIDGQGDVGFDVAVPCPHDDECTSTAWVPAYSVTCLYRALNGDLDDEDIICTVHGPHRPDDRDDDPERRVGLEAQYADAVRE
ncbi:ATP-binding protein [Streptomyces daghestanicus]|uniref:ATP/GTP-binding protein n=1 Tax=Streptomyces daghestanicus TaxID=66885 RepID=A0ABQ3Q7E9_9ACTN|nr:ATP-binding protein [Streptomyces daghestanicus]GGU66553.1 ATP/GTP-binding protein [Streptomyces daghestanicus]GHI33210.1 ATP/GTP-binding protein [Streptomyces daghestanicus]